MTSSSTIHILTGTIPTSVGEVTQGNVCAAWAGICHPTYFLYNLFMKRCNAYNAYYLVPPNYYPSAYCMRKCILSI